MRKGDTRGLRERLHGRPLKIVSTRTLLVRIFPIGWEAPKGKINPTGRENCQSIVHGQRGEDLTLHHYLLKPLNCIQSKFRSRRSLQSGLMGLCGRNLKEKLECSNGIHDGKNWHQIRISRSGERQKICRIVAMKIRGNILCSGELGGLCCRWNVYHQNLDMIDEMKHLPGAWIWKNISLLYYSPFGGNLRSVVYVSLLQ